MTILSLINISLNADRMKLALLTNKIIPKLLNPIKAPANKGAIIEDDLVTIFLIAFPSNKSSFKILGIIVSIAGSNINEINDKEITII